MFKRIVALVLVAVTAAGCGGSSASLNPTAPSPVVTVPPDPTGTLVGQVFFNTSGLDPYPISEMSEVPLRVIRLVNLQSTEVLNSYNFSAMKGVGEVIIKHNGAPCTYVLQNLSSQRIFSGAQIELFKD